MQNRVRAGKEAQGQGYRCAAAWRARGRRGLRLVVEPPKDKKPGPRRWVLRVTIAGKRHNTQAGPLPVGEPG